MDEMTPAANREEVLHNEAVLAAAGAPITFKGIRPPFGGSNPDVQKLLLEMGYTYFLNRIDGAGQPGLDLHGRRHGHLHPQRRTPGRGRVPDDHRAGPGRRRRTGDDRARAGPARARRELECRGPGGDQRPVTATAAGGRNRPRP